MPDVYSLPYNQVSMKGSHNSYQRDEPFIEQILFDSKKPYNSGCQAVELDIAQSDREGENEWSVGHAVVYVKAYRQLSLFLGELKKYHTDTPRHDVVTLYLDIKGAQDDFIQKLDAYILRFLDSPMYTPGELMGKESNLSMGAKKNGWPTLTQLKGKFIVVLTGEEEYKSRYAKTEPKKRLCFADKDFDADQKPVSQTRVFFNYHLYSSEKNKWCPVFREAAGRANAIIRGYELDGKQLWNDALDCGCHILATNQIRGSEWARVGSQPFTQLKPLAAVAARA